MKRFFIQHKNPVRAAIRRAIKAAGGIRQFKRQRRARRAARARTEYEDFDARR